MVIIRLVDDASQFLLNVQIIDDLLLDLGQLLLFVKIFLLSEAFPLFDLALLNLLVQCAGLLSLFLQLGETLFFSGRSQIIEELLLDQQLIKNFEIFVNL